MRAPGRSWLVKVAVKIVVAGRLVALDVLPPVTHKVLLVEDGSDRAQESIAATIRLADVEDLTPRLDICVVSGLELLGAAIEACLRNCREGRII